MAIAVDGSGNILVTGQSMGSTNFLDYDYATIKYSNAGIPLWTNRYNGPGGSWDSATAIATDTNGNVFVTGYSASNGANYDYATIKYSGMGVPLWTNRYDGPGNGYDNAVAVAMNGSGDVFVTGYSTNNNTGYDYATIKYSSAGVPLWTNRYDAGTGKGDIAAAIKVSSDGTVLVAGTSYNGYNTIAYSVAGAPLWTNIYRGPGGDDEAVAMAGDTSGNIFVTGYSLDNSSVQYAYDFATVAYSSTGVPLWTNRYSAESYPAGVAVDSSGNVFVTGFHIISGANHDYVTIKYAGMQPVLLRILTAGNAQVLTWTNPTFQLQTAPNATGAFMDVPSAASPYTNIPTGTQQFFRLRLN